MGYFRFFTVFTLVSMLLSGCGNDTAEKDDSATKNMTSEQRLLLRATSRWDALAAGNNGDAYEFLSKGSRSLMTKDYYIKTTSSGRMVWKGGAAESTECMDETTCEVKVVLSYIYYGTLSEMNGQEMTTVLRERWILEDGLWWFVPK